MAQVTEDTQPKPRVINPKGFQSRGAERASRPKKKQREVIEDALIQPPTKGEDDEDGEEALSSEEMLRREFEPVKIKPKVNVPKTRIGNREDGQPAWYAFTANKKCFVPRHVARMLVEKNVIDGDYD